MIPKLEDIRYALAEKSLADFIRLGWPFIDPADYVGNWHIDAIAEHLEAVAEGDIRRLIINIPPRHMKSLSVAVAFPAWIWAQRKRSKLTGPSVGFLSTSYAQKLSERDNVKCRRVIDSRWYQAGWGDRFRMTSDQNTKGRFENDQGGYRIASSVDGTATGDGGDIVTIDDPISAGNAQSPTMRAAANDWFDMTMSTRLNDPRTGAYIIIMQRLHQDDLVGHILARSSEDWTMLCLPARYEANHPHVYLGDPRKVDGELLWPERMAEDEVCKLELALGSYGSAGQLQQRPSPREGGLFKRSYFAGKIISRDSLPSGYMTQCRAWDFASSIEKPGRSPDASAGVLMGRIGTDYFVQDVDRMFATPGQVRATVDSHGETDPRGTIIRIPQDPGQAGVDQRDSYITALAGYNVQAIRPTGSKWTRAEPFAIQAENGHVYLVNSGPVEYGIDPWIEAFIEELCAFPNGQHDDQVDAASDAFNELAGKQRGRMDAASAGRRDVVTEVERGSHEIKRERTDMRGGWGSSSSSQLMGI